MKTRTFFKIKINIPDLDNYFPRGEECKRIYEAELVIKETDVKNIILKIFFESKEYLADKIMYWSNKNALNLTDKFEVIEILQPENLINIDFSDYTHIGITKSSKYFENNFQYLTVKLSGVIKIFKNTEKDISEFYLNNQAFNLIELNYNYGFLPWDTEPCQLNIKNKVEKFISFNKIKFKPEHNFYNSKALEEQEIIIKKEPKLSVEYSGLDYEEIKNNIRLLCVLYSFYSKQNIDYYFSRIYTEDKLYLEFRNIESFNVKNPHGLFRFDFCNNPLNLIININSSHLYENLEFINTIVSRFNYALNTNGESRFMILYNILEQVRNQYILDKKIEKEKVGDPPNLKKVTEEYHFTKSKNQTDKFIKKNLEAITEIVSDEHKELFQQEIKYKVLPIKVMSMINQFQSLFNYIDIKPEKFDLDFKKLKSLRDSIFHGRPINENKEYLEEVNYFKRLPKFTGIVLLRYFGIHDLKKITKVG